ncbi:MAG: oligosaccharide flippase family protein [Bacteroidetes bacterium]|nr:oligosaccharide flippase family protein [Bacteroidota bacterium]
MLDRLRNTLKHSIIYGLGKLGTKIIGLVLLPLYTEYLTTEQYGMLSLLEATSQIMVGMLGFRLSAAMMRWIATEKDQQKNKTVVFTTYLSTFFFSLVICLILIPFTGFLSELYFDSGDFSRYFLILIISVAIDLPNQVTFDLIRMAEKSWLFGLIIVSKLAVVLGLNIYFIVHLHLGVEGIILGMLSGNLVMLLMSLPFILKRVNYRYEFSTFRELFGFGFPLIFATMSVMILSFADRFIIKKMLDLSEVGIYTVGYKIAGVINLVVLQAFSLGFIPTAYKMFDKPEAKRFFSKILTYLTYVLMLAVLVISFFSREVIEVFTAKPEYWPAYKIVPIIAFTFLVKGWQSVVVMGMHRAKKTFLVAATVMVAAILNIGLNFALIPFLGIYGSALASVIATFIGVYLSYRYSQKYFPINYEFVKIIKILITGIGLLIVYYYINELTLVLRLFLKVILLMSFPFLLYLIGFYDKVELERIGSFWRSWRNPGRWKENLRRVVKSKDDDE